MGIGINHRNKYAIENNPRVLKSNYGSRPDYSIETEILQKRLIYDNSKLTNQTIAYNITDLKAYYNR